MKLFIHFDDSGRILSVAKVQERQDQSQHPFLHAENPDQVAEVEPSPELLDLDAHEIAEQYRVNPKSKGLEKIAAGRAEPTRAAKPAGQAKRPRRTRSS